MMTGREPRSVGGTANLTFQDTLTRNGVRFRRGIGDPNKIHLCCPFCSERGRGMDEQFRLCVHLKAGWGRCVHCEWKSSRALGYVLRRLRVEEDFDEPGIGEPLPAPDVHLPEDFHRLVTAVEELDVQAREYLLYRGITERQIRALNIGVSYVGRYAYRVLFPLYVRRTLRGIVARGFTERSKPKYLFNMGSKYLYHFNPDSETCILSEGVFKALRIQQVTRYCSAALLGHSLAPEQLKQMRESKCRTVILYPDPDPAGWRGAVSVADRLCEECAVEVYAVSPGMPADEDSLKSIRHQTESAEPYGWRLRQKFLLRGGTA